MWSGDVGNAIVASVIVVVLLVLLWWWWQLCQCHHSVMGVVFLVPTRGHDCASGGVGDAIMVSSGGGGSIGNAVVVAAVVVIA